MLLKLVLRVLHVGFQISEIYLVLDRDRFKGKSYLALLSGHTYAMQLQDKKIVFPAHSYRTPATTSVRPSPSGAPVPKDSTLLHLEKVQVE